MYEELTTLSEYIKEKKQVLKDFGVYKYCTSEEKAELKAAKNDIEADRICRRLIDTHLDEAINEDTLMTNHGDVMIEALNIPIKLRCAIMNNKIHTVQELIDRINKNGWDSIHGIGKLSAEKLFSCIYPEKTEKEITNIVKKFKHIKK